MTSALKLARPALAAPALSLAVFITAGCGLFQHSQVKSSAAAAPAAVPSLLKQQIQASESAPVRHVGDFFVHRFSGSFASDPLTLTEEVAALEDAAWVV